MKTFYGIWIVIDGDTDRFAREDYIEYAYVSDCNAAIEIEQKLNILGQHGLRKLHILNADQKFKEARVSEGRTIDNHEAILKKLDKGIKDFIEV